MSHDLRKYTSFVRRIIYKSKKVTGWVRKLIGLKVDYAEIHQILFCSTQLSLNKLRASASMTFLDTCPFGLRFLDLIQSRDNDFMPWKLQVQLMTPFEKIMIFCPTKSHKKQIHGVHFLVSCLLSRLAFPVNSWCPPVASGNVPRTDEFTFYFPRLSWKNTLTQSMDREKKTCSKVPHHSLQPGV